MIEVPQALCQSVRDVIDEHHSWIEGYHLMQLHNPKKRGLDCVAVEIIPPKYRMLFGDDAALLVTIYEPGWSLLCEDGVHTAVLDNALDQWSLNEETEEPEKSKARYLSPRCVRSYPQGWCDEAMVMTDAVRHQLELFDANDLPLTQPLADGGPKISDRNAARIFRPMADVVAGMGEGASVTLSIPSTGQSATITSETVRNIRRTA